MNIGTPSPPKTILLGCIGVIFLIQGYHCYFLSVELSSPLPGRSWPPGSPWPLPLSWSRSNVQLTFDPAKFKIVKNFTNPCKPIDFAIGKYSNDFLFPVYGNDRSATAPGYVVLDKLVITFNDNRGGGVENECSKYPSLSIDPATHEHYNLQITISKGKGIATIVAKTVWGALHGVETFSQLIWSNEDNRTEIDAAHFWINVTAIDDKPRFSHRGLMIDSGRRYLPERIFYEILDGMKYNKLNVLHWHIVDDQSFPYVSKKFPELSKKGAYNDKAIYTPEAVQRIIEAARLRGIRVILEFDTPGHTHGFGKAHPELLTPCYGNGPGGDPEATNYRKHSGRENLDPTKNFTYKFMKDFFSELRASVVKDQHIHLGMDEVYSECWNKYHNPVIKTFMAKQGYHRVEQVEEHYVMRHVKMVKSLNFTPICWQDPLDSNVNLDKDVIIQVWKDWQRQVKNIVSKGYRAILSSPWYMNYIEYGETWMKYYKADPIKSISSLTEDEKKRILGGEACIWGEFADKTNIVPRIFPFVSAIGERLWTFDMGIDDAAANDARGRLDQHRCRLLRRGIQAQPSYPGFCGRWETENRRKRR